MDPILLGISIAVLGIFLAVYIYFLVRPAVTVGYGDYGSDNPVYNPNAFPPGWKSALNYSCVKDDDCESGLVCDAFEYLCKLPDGDLCSSQSDCTTSSFCNIWCYPNTVDVGYNHPDGDDALGMLAPCPDGFGSTIGTGPNGQVAYVCLKVAQAGCNLDSECISGNCAGNNCQFGYGLGHSCTQDTDCGSQFCVSGFCQAPGAAAGGSDLGFTCSPSGYKCQRGTTCVGGHCQSSDTGLGDLCSYYNTCPGSMICYNIQVSLEDDCLDQVGCTNSYSASLCSQDDERCSCSFYIAPTTVDNPNTVISNQSCINGMFQTGTTCLPGQDQPSIGICSNGSTLATSSRLYIISATDYDTDNSFPISGLIGAKNIQYKSINVTGVDLNTVTAVKGVVYGYKSNGTATSPLNLLLFLSGTNLYYGELLNGSVTVKLYNNSASAISVSYSRSNDSFIPHVYILRKVSGVTSIYELTYVNKTIVETFITSANGSYIYLSSLYTYGEDGLGTELLTFYVSDGLNSYLVTRFVMSSSTTYNWTQLSGVAGNASLTDLSPEDSYSLSVAFISNNVWQIAPINGTTVGLSNFTFPNYPTGISTYTTAFSIQPSSTVAFSYNNMTSITSTTGPTNDLFMYFYSTGRTTSIPGYFDNNTIVEVTPANAYVLVDNYCR